MIEQEILSLSDREISAKFPKQEEIKESPWKGTLKEGDFVMFLNDKIEKETIKTVPKFLEFYGVKKVIQVYKENNKILLSNGEEAYIKSIQDYKKLNYEEFTLLKQGLIVQNLYPKTIVDKINHIKRAVSTVVPEENYDIILPELLVSYEEMMEDKNYYNNNLLKIMTDVIIYYPELTITNDIGMSHCIKDLYARFRFVVYKYGIQITSFGIKRSTVSSEELLNTEFYLHSHVNGGYPGEWYSFCFGTSPYKTLYNKLSHANNHSFIDLQNLFFGLETILSWESIEGTPYRYLSNLGTSKYSFIYENSISVEELERIVINTDDKNFLYSSLDEFDYSIDRDKVENPIKIKIPDEVRNKLFKYIKENTNNNEGKICINHSGNYKLINSMYNYFLRRAENSVRDKHPFIFKGEEIIPKMIKIDEEVNEPNDVHPFYLKALLLPLEKEFFKFLTKKQNDDNY